jgi:nucleotide-binding universal stress UspA family protein
MDTRRILVAVDYSPQSIEAARVAIDLASQLGAQVLLLTVLDVGDLRVALKAHLYAFKTDTEVHRAVRRWIHDQAARVEVPEGVRCVRRVRRGIADQEILSAIRSYRPQLVVMGSRGLARRLALGSTTAAVLRRSPVPVLVVTQTSGVRRPSASRPRRSGSASRR